MFAHIATAYLVHASAAAEQQRISEQLQQALVSRLVIEQAKGMIAAQRQTSVDEAFLILRRHARDHHARLREIADAVVSGGLVV